MVGVQHALLGYVLWAALYFLCCRTYHTHSGNTEAVDYSDCKAREAALNTLGYLDVAHLYWILQNLPGCSSTTERLKYSDRSAGKTALATLAKLELQT